MRILVITVSSWNSKVGANSWGTLLEKCDASLVANICIRDEKPDSPVCSRYFSISENKIIRSIFNKKVQTGQEIDATHPANDENDDLAEHNRRYQKMTVKRRYSMLLCRELIWKFGNWKTKELDDFLDSVKPDIILHSMEGYIHLNRITQYAIKRTGARAVGYIWDDNFTYKQHKNWGYKLYRFFQRRSLKSLSRMTREFFAITPYTKKEADEFFKINAHVLTKPLSRLPIAEKAQRKLPLRMVYTGNLLIGRDQSLLALSRALRELNREKVRILLDVYTQTVLPQELLEDMENEFCRVHKPIAQVQALEKQRQADILLFLEAMDGKDAKVARLSFSTKITDYLSTGKCIFALGNQDTAPIQYFLENEAALVCTKEGELLENLQKIADAPALLEAFTQNACRTARKNHDPEKIKKIFDSVLQKTLNEGKEPGGL